MSYHLEFVKITAKTEKAIQFTLQDEDGDRRSVWIPISQIEDDPDDYEVGEGEELGSIMISDWIANEKGLT